MQLIIKSFILTLTILIGNFAYASESYKSTQLEKMPFHIQAAFKEKMKNFDLDSVFLNQHGSKVLGVNMIFSDPFMSSRVILKYAVAGNYKLNKLYKMKDGFLYHTRLQGKKEIALYFENMDSHLRSRIIRSVKTIKVSHHSFSLIPSAHADSSSCFNSNVFSKLPLDTSVADSSAGGIFSSCMSGIGEGAKDSTVGVFKDAYNGAKKLYNKASNEVSSFLKNPFKKVSDYWKRTVKLVKDLAAFAQTLGKMVIDPAYGMKVMSEKFGEIGTFFSNVYSGIKNLSREQKTEIICNILGSIGVDALITAVTAGVGGAKLAITITRLMLKLKKITTLLSKGMKVPFKVLEKFSDKVLDQVDGLIKAGKKSLLDKKLKEVGCAI